MYISPQTIRCYYILTPIVSSFYSRCCQQIPASKMPNTRAITLVNIFTLLGFFAKFSGSSVIYICLTEEEHCPTEPCYSLSETIHNAVELFTSNTVALFPPGNHTVGNAGESLSLIIREVSNVTLIGGGCLHCNDYTVLICIGNFNLAFVNSANAIISKLHFVNCGAAGPKEAIKRYTNGLSVPPIATLYLIQVYSINVSETTVLHSVNGAGLVGINLLGSSSITKSTFKSNKPNCYIMFTATQNVKTMLHITHSNFFMGINSGRSYGAGLTVWIVKEVSDVHVRISSIAMNNNNGAQYGNFLIRIEKCMSNSTIQVDDIKIVEEVSRSATCSGKEPVSLHLTYRSNEHCVHDTSSFRALQEPIINISNIDLFHGTILLESFYKSGVPIKIKNLKVSNTQVRAALHITKLTAVALQNVNFTQNKQTALLVEYSNILIAGNNIFKRNSGIDSPILSQTSNIYFNGSSILIQNTGRNGGALYAKESYVLFEGHTAFIENSAKNGGALTLSEDSYIGGAGNITFLRNSASYYGGALYVDATGFNRCYSCTITLLCFFLPNTYNVTYYYKDNVAGTAGSAIYGGWIDLCDFEANVLENPRDSPPFYFQANESDLSIVASDPTRVCICPPDEAIPDCRLINYEVAVYPGEKLQILAAAVGQRFGIVPTTIQSELLTQNSELEPLQYKQAGDRFCTRLSYTVMSPNEKEVMKLTVDSAKTPDFPTAGCYKNMVYESPEKYFCDMHISITMLPCPKGFEFNRGKKICSCHPLLHKYNIPCRIDSQTVTRRSPLWINSTTVNSTYEAVIIHKHCPFDYCNTNLIQLNLEYPDEQCAFDRSGILCGACQHNLSHVLGSSNCKECSSLWLLLFIPAFALAGIILVIFLMVLNLTVSIGTINGLIFYANIVRANRAIFFPHNTSNSFLSWFIAWVNLDLGIETCFYSGLDAYAKTWLQFFFPIYIWLVVMIIIVSSHYYTMAARLAGRNSVKVLATLFILSYAKLLRVTIAILSSTTLEYPDGSVRRVWLYDGNVDYLKGKHVPLFMAALLVLLVLSLPYTALLLFIQCLQLKSKYRVLFWIGKFKPLFDAYTGPYKDKHRYWTGFLLLIRVVLFLTFSVNVFGDPAINLLVVLLAILLLLVKLAFYGGIYKATYLNALELSFLLNLGLLSSCTLYNQSAGVDQKVFTHISTSIAFATFIAVILYHAVIRMGQLGCFRNVTAKAFLVKLGCCCREPKPNSATEHPPNDTNRHTPPRQVPVSFIDLREPLLEHCT